MGKTKKQIMAKSVVAFSLNEFDPSYTRVLIGSANFRYYDFINLGALELITGYADFDNSKVESLGNLTTIGGGVYFGDRTDLEAEWEKRKNK